MSFRSLLVQSWQHKSFLTWLLLPLSGAYGVLSWLRQQAYKSGLKESYRAPIPVIVVGNITVGGTGKTPLVVHLVELLQSKGYRPGVISRGYTSAATDFPMTVSAQTPADLAGDEPLLITKRTGVPMVIGPNRAASIKRLISEFEVDVIISDDGLQHLAMQRDIEVCLLDMTSQSDNNFLLPAGPYRESMQRLQSVDLVVEHHSHNVAITDGRYHMQLSPDDVMAITGGAWKQSSQVHAVAGIGNPTRFFNTCRQLGLNIIEHVFDDHHQYQFSDIDFSDDLSVLMTEKDAVKCIKFADERHAYLPVSAQLDGEFDAKVLMLVRVAIARL